MENTFYQCCQLNFKVSLIANRIWNAQLFLQQKYCKNRKASINFWEQGQFLVLLDDTITQMRMHPVLESSNNNESRAWAYNVWVLLDDFNWPSEIWPTMWEAASKCRMASDPKPVGLWHYNALRNPGPMIGRPNTSFVPYSNASSTVLIPITLDMVEVVVSKSPDMPGREEPIWWPCPIGFCSLERHQNASRFLLPTLTCGWQIETHFGWPIGPSRRAAWLLLIKSQVWDQLPLVKCTAIFLQNASSCKLARKSFMLLNLCAGLKAGFKGALHAFQSLWDKSLSSSTISTVASATAHGTLAGHMTTDGTTDSTKELDGTTHGSSAGTKTSITHGTWLVLGLWMETWMALEHWVVPSLATAMVLRPIHLPPQRLACHIILFCWLI